MRPTLRCVLIASLLLSSPCFAKKGMKKRRMAPRQEMAAEAPAADGAVQSEILHQAPAGHLEITPALTYSLIKYTFDSTASVDTAETTATYLGAEVEYGLNSMFSVEVDLRYQNATTEFEPGGGKSKSKGLLDPAFKLNGMTRVGPGLLRFGAELDIAIEDDETDVSNDSNAASGGHTLTPLIGYEFATGTAIFGGALTYDIYKGDRSIKDDGSTPSKTTGKDGRVMILAAFGEFMMNSTTRLGGMIQHISSEETKTESNGVTRSNNNATTALTFSGYVPYEATPSLTILPAFTFGSYNAPDQSSVNDVRLYSAHVDFRITM